MKLDPITMGCLFDEYGALLTEKQRDCIDLYYNQDLSLAEIAEELQISRQGVHDSLNRAEATLLDLEAALGNIANADRLHRALAEIAGCADALQGSRDETVRALAARIAAISQTLL